MSRRNDRSSVRLDLKPNLSPARRGREAIRGAGRQAPPEADSPDSSPARSCVSSEDGLRYSSSPETTSMVVVGCARCLMYVMLSEVDPMCPKCKSTVLLNPIAAARRRYDDEDGDGGATVN